MFNIAKLFYLDKKSEIIFTTYSCEFLKILGARARQG